MKILFNILLIALILAMPLTALAANPQFSLRPGSGNVLVGKKFTVDLMINSKGNSISLARAGIKFNPELVQVVSASRNESLFCQYPEDSQLIDNDGGKLVITGFCQSGVGQPYKTTGEADVFARVTFKVLKSGTINLEWDFTGDDEPQKSVLLKDGSPPTNILKSKPGTSKFIATRGSVGTNNPDNTPNTGLGISAGLVGGGIALIVLGFLYSKWSDYKTKSKLRTVVDYGNSIKQP